MDLNRFAVCILCVFNTLTRLGVSFNIDTDNPVIFTGGELDDAYFGYTVLQHSNDEGQWILVGAPRDNSSFQPTIERPGALYKCNVQLPDECEQVLLDNEGNEREDSTRPYYEDSKDNQWLGVSMTTENSNAPNIAVCGHRWANNIYRNNIFPKGVCYIINSGLQFSSVRKVRPCLGEKQIQAAPDGRGIAWHGWCQAGFSAHFTQTNSLLLGAVGSIAWRGTVISMDNAQSTPRLPTLNWYSENVDGMDETTYIGYAMSSGHFFSDATVEGVTGAPRAYQVGRAFVFDSQDFVVLMELRGEQMGAYFGSSVCAVDLNNDGLSDLLVGAPLYAELVDEGRVYVYINRGQGVLKQNDDLLKGSNTPNSRFGTVIASIGDINMDGYKDVAIGAPYESSGVVYIYHGTSSGITDTYVQAIKGDSVVPGIKSFGLSITGGLDLDGNAYQDIVVGAYKNNTAVLFKTQPVIDVSAELHVSPRLITSNNTQCPYQNGTANCIVTLVCFRYRGTAVPSTIALEFKLDVESFKISTGQSGRVHIVVDDTSVGVSLTDTVILRYGVHYCESYQVHIKENVNDFLTPIPFDLSYNLVTSHSSVSVCNPICPVLNAHTKRREHAEVAFVRNCGIDEECVADLRINAVFKLPRGYTFLPLGVFKQLTVSIAVNNYGEDAHQTQVLINYPRQLTLIRVENNDLGSIVHCEPDDTLSDDTDTSGITCDVGNPMTANSEKSFNVILDSSRISADKDVLDVSLVAVTSSNDTSFADNFIDIRLPIRIAADVAVTGFSFPEQIHLSTEHLASSKSQCDINGPYLTHTFDIRNLGPGNIPYNSHVKIDWPWKMPNGDYLLHIRFISVRGTGSCASEHIFDQQAEDSMCNKTSKSSVYIPLEDRGMDCNSVQCTRLDCFIGPLDVGSSTRIEVSAQIQQSSLLTLIGDQPIEIMSYGEVLVEDSQGDMVQPDKHQPDSVHVVTVVYDIITEGDGQIAPWVIAVSVVCGLLALATAIVLLWKIGFFRRKTKEELQKLLEIHEEDTSTWTIQCDNSLVIDNNSVDVMVPPSYEQIVSS
ncbi:integrin alpha-9-like [Glandiceps talaboti]